MKLFKRTVALLLTLVILSGSMMCFAVDGEKQYYNYDKILLLGDSQNSGFVDYGYVFTEYTRVEDSYAAYVSDELGGELLPYACPGFRTVELRYLLDDTYRPDDKYLFEAVPHTTMDEFVARAGEVRDAIDVADMIMIGIGGNDWGAYLGWVAEDIQEANTLPEDFKVALTDYLKSATIDEDSINQILKIADTFNALDEFVELLPGAVNYAFSNLRINWEWLVEYIYEHNPDVTLLVVGMFPTYFSTEEGAPDVVATPNAGEKLVEDAMIDFGNLHMIEGQEKYGYIYVDTYGTTVEVCHPTVAGQRFLADRILEELPDARFQCKEDVALRNPNYKAIEYVVVNGIIAGTSETTFSPDAPLTQDVLSKALNVITGDYAVTDKTNDVSKFTFAFNLFKAADKSDFKSFFSALKFSMNIITSANNKITRGEAAKYLCTFAK